ncbi:MAG: Ig-like domain-containing protein, partial [Muribaculaceae bacterium]|nr:Ig-like domain-containing protein [Muribaculaceae bacterium]
MKIFKQLSRSLLLSLSSAVSFVTLVSCANIGNPSGGPRDEDPPVFISADPAPGSVNVNKTRMTLTFNELVNVKDAFSKVVVSPVGKSVPKVMSLGKKVTVTFDSIQPNTTYTIDFADAIEDNNESNQLQGFSYTFSTGEEIDTLRISGMVLDARNMEPQQAMIVGVTANNADSAFTKLPLLRVAKTDDQGRFTIRGLKEGSYRVYALGDKDN